MHTHRDEKNTQKKTNKQTNEQTSKQAYAVPRHPAFRFCNFGQLESPFAANARRIRKHFPQQILEGAATRLCLTPHLNSKTTKQQSEKKNTQNDIMHKDEGIVPTSAKGMRRDANEQEGRINTNTVRYKPRTKMTARRNLRRKLYTVHYPLRASCT